MIEIKDKSVSEADELKKFVGFCETVDFPTAIFNSSLECVYSKKGIIPLKTKINLYLNRDELFTSETFISTIFVIKGVQYCAKIIKTDRFYICGLFDSHELGRIARNTDFFSRLLPTIDVFQYNLVHLWDIMVKLRDMGNSKIAADMEEYLVKTNLVSQNIIEYVDMIFKKPNYVRIDCGELLERIINRCNTFLSKCGRYIDYVKVYEACYIHADRRHAICAIINALQNSLLYSPKDSVPIVTLQKCVIDKKDYVVLKIVNENSYYSEKQNELSEDDFSKHKIGCGIPIIKRLMEEADGEFTLEEVDGRVITIMKMPALKECKNDAIILECDEYTYFETGIPDYLDFKMREVIDLFKEDVF